MSLRLSWKRKYDLLGRLTLRGTTGLYLVRFVEVAIPVPLDWQDLGTRLPTYVLGRN